MNIHGTKATLDHKGGTKSYHITTLESEAGPAIVIYRWGKTGQFGQIKVERFSSGAAAEHAVMKKVGEKRSGGYIERPVSDSLLRDEAGLKTFLTTPVLMAIGRDDILHVIPGFDISFMRAVAKPVEYNEEGYKQDVAQRAKFSPEQVAETERLAEATRIAKYQAIPGFGRF